MNKFLYKKYINDESILKLLFKSCLFLTIPIILSSCASVANVADSVASKAREIGFSSTSGRYLKTYYGGKLIAQIDMLDANTCRLELASDPTAAGLARCENSSSADVLLVSAVFVHVLSGQNIEVRATTVPACELMVKGSIENVKFKGQLSLIRSCKYFQARS